MALGAFGLAALALAASIAVLNGGPDSVSAQQQSTDQDLTLHGDNASPRGIWSDGSTMWVADFSDKKLYAYSLADKARIENKDISLGNFNFKALGIWSDGTTIWVLNTADDRIRGFSLSDGSRETTRDISLDDDNDIPAGIWSDRTTMYVVDQNDKKLFAYALSDGARQSESDIDISIDRPRPIGLWSDGSTFWISYDHHGDYVQDDHRKLYAFDFEDGTRVEESDVPISTDANSRSSGLWSDGDTIWVADKFHRKIFGYQLPQPTLSTDATLSSLHLSGVTLTPNFAATTTTYAATAPYTVASVTVSATPGDRSATVVILDGNDDELPDTDLMKAGHQAKLAVNENVFKIQVTAEDELSVQTYTVTVTREKPLVSVTSNQAEVFEGDTAEFAVMRDAAIPEQLEVKLSVSETESLIPNSELGSRTITIPSNATSTALSLTTDSNDDQWENHSTVSVAIEDDSGYQIDSMASTSSVLILDNDFPEATAALAVSPSTVLEGATATATITVTTQADKEPHGAAGTLILSQVEDTADAGDFAMLDQGAFAISPEDFTAVSVGEDQRYRAQYAATIAIVDDSIVEVGESFDIEVSKDTGASDNLTLVQPAAVTLSILDNDAALSSLGLSGISLTPEFSSDVLKYTAQVDYTVEETTVSASAGHMDSTEPTILHGGAAVSDGVADLDVGENRISVQVVAEDATSTATYLINVTRARPSVSIEAVAPDVDEGQAVGFNISRNAAVSEQLDLSVTVTESGSLVQSDNLGSRTVTISGAATTTTISVSTDADDDLWEPHSVVTATINDDDTIDIQTGAGASSTQVNDDDFPEATADLIVAPNPVSEGATVSATIRVTTKSEEEPHGDGGTLTLAAQENTAHSADFGRFGKTSFQVRAGDFELVDVSGVARYQASYTAAVAIADDSDSESDESFYVTASKTDAPRIELPETATTSVVITANDSSTDPTLSQLSLSAGTLSPPFTSTTTRYSASLGYAVEQITLRPVVNSDKSEVEFLDSSNGELIDASSGDDGHQIDLNVGLNIIKVRVTAEDTVSTKTYTIEVTRQKPVASIISKHTDVAEGAELAFNVARNAPASESLEVRVDVRETGSMVATSEEGIRTITIPPNSTSTSFAVSSEHDDHNWEIHSTVSATINANDAYTIKQDEGRAETIVSDDDFPEASATLSVSPTEISEGDDATLSIAVTTTHDRDPHGGGGALTLTRVGGTAQSEDYGSLSQTTFAVAASDFLRVDLGEGNMAYRAEYTATLETSDDSESEPDETIVFLLGRETASENIKIEGAATATVTILANDASSDASLSAIGLSDGTLTPLFSTDTTSYTASVAYGVEYLTVDVSRGDIGASVSIRNALDAALVDTNEAPGHQVKLSVGENVLRLVVTSEDGEESQTYVVTITRAKPTVGILRGPAHVSEGQVLTFEISRGESTTESLVVTVDVTESGMLLAAGEQGRRTITIPGGATSTSFALTGDTDDEVWEEHSTVTASIVESVTYDIASGRERALVQIEDDDFPEASAALSVSPDPVTEGETLTALVSVTTASDRQPHGSGGALLLTLTGDTAQADDFQPPHEVEFKVAAKDFVLVDLSGDTRYRANYTATTTITDDAEAEQAETLEVSLSKRSAERITLPAPSTSTVTISPSDLSEDASLRSLEVSDGALSPMFASGTTSYTVQVGYGVERILITPVANDSNATITSEMSPADNGQGYVVDLPAGTSTLEVSITSQNSAATTTYSIVVVRANPEVSISPMSSEVIEGAPATFTVIRNAAVSESLEVRTEITDSGNLVPDSDYVSVLRTIPGGATSTTLTVRTGLNDETWGEHSEVTATLMAGDGYLIKPGGGSAHVRVKDDDFPEAVASLSVDPSTVVEGGTVNLSVAVTTVRDEAPHTDGGLLIVQTANDSAIGGTDYVELLSVDGRLSFTQSDFAPVDENGQTRFQAVKLLEIKTLADDVQEGVEKFVITLDKMTGGPMPTSNQISLAASSQTVAVLIEDGPGGELASLALSEGALVPPFGTSTQRYSSEVPYGVEQITVSAATTRGSADLTFLDGNNSPIADLDGNTDGHQAPLEVGENILKIRVSETNGTVLGTYTVTITRVEPVVGIAGTTTSVVEGETATFVIRRDAAPSEPLDVTLSVAETGALVSASLQGEVTRSVTIPGSATSTTLSLNSDPDDELWEDHSTITAAIIPRAIYAIAADSGRAEIQISDDDFPAATATLAVSPIAVTEGRNVVAVVTVTTQQDQQPHRGSGAIQLATVGLSATSGADFTPPPNDQLTFAQSDFDAVDVGDETRYSATKQVVISTANDDVYEGDELFTIEIGPVSDGSSPTASHIVFDPSESLREVSISDDDVQPPDGVGNNADEPPNTNGSQTSGGVRTGGGGGGGGGGSSRSTSNHEPKFEEGGETTRSVLENSAIHTKVGARVSAVDRDGDRLTYSIEGGDRSSFTISGSSGRLYSAVALDREVDARYYLTIAVSDGKGGTDSIEVTILVMDENEPPSVTGDQVVTYPEQTSGVIANYNANDPENGEIRWVLSGVDSAVFDIVEGAILFRTPPDFENPTDSNDDNSYDVTIGASDGDHTSTLDIVVTVIDLDEAPSPTPTLLPTPRPTHTRVPTPTSTHAPTVTPTVTLSQMPTPTPTGTLLPQPTVTPTATSVPIADTTLRLTKVPTLVSTPTVTPTASLVHVDMEASTHTPLPITPLSQNPAAKAPPLRDEAATPQPEISPTLIVDLNTPTATPQAIIISTEDGNVPAWFMLSITFWAILATGVGVYVYMRRR